jgi:SAM-dependent methyltransferase
MNLFEPKSAAERYAQGRPYHHDLAVAHIRAYAGLPVPVERAIDVGCGTGMSCVALKDISERVVGVDSSAEMLAQAPVDDRIEYINASAEELPVPADDFDLLTVSSAFHWFDKERFLAEAARVLRSGGWAVIYTDFFCAVMRETPEFTTWMRDAYTKRYPVPPRHKHTLDAGDAERHGFGLVHEEQFENDVPMTIDELADYLLTQTNTIAAIERGVESVDGVRAWLLDELEQFFGDGLAKGTFVYRTALQYLRKGISGG